LGIKPKLAVDITVRIHGYIFGRIEFNGQSCVEGLNHFSADLHDDLHLVSVIQKFAEGTSAVEIADFTVNGYNVIPKYQHLSSSGNAYHDWAGAWEMVIPKTFYAWYHTASGQGWIA
jgi:hypothetical protein